MINLTTASGWTKPIQPLAGEQLQQEPPTEAVACESNMTALFGGEAALFVPGHQRNSSVAQSENKPPSIGIPPYSDRVIGESLRYIYTYIHIYTCLLNHSDCLKAFTPPLHPLYHTFNLNRSNIWLNNEVLFHGNTTDLSGEAALALLMPVNEGKRF